jgi:excisionase family DNA binding protein
MRRQTKDTNPGVQPLLLTIPEVAATLQLGRTKVYELISAEGLPIVKFGTATRISLISLQKWVEQREEQSLSA